MAKYNVQIKIEAKNAVEAQVLGDLLQCAATVVEYNDIVRLLQKVKEKPSIVKTALKFI